MGARPTEQQLEPRRYKTPSGIVQATLKSLISKSEVNDTLASWRYEGQRLDEVTADRDSRGTFDKAHTALMGAVKTLGLAGEQDLELSSREPDFPDLHVVQSGKKKYYLEVTDVRRDGSFFAKIWEVQQALAEKLESEEQFRALFGGRRHSLSFVREVRRKDVQEFCKRFVEWAVQRDWLGSDDICVDDPWLMEYVPAITRRIVSINPGVALDATPPTSILCCARLGNAFPQEDYLPAVLNAIEVKKAKRYRADAPIWLAITAVQPLDALMLRVAAVDVDPGQFSRIYLSDGQDTLLYEIVAP